MRDICTIWGNFNYFRVFLWDLTGFLFKSTQPIIQESKLWKCTTIFVLFYSSLEFHYCTENLLIHPNCCCSTKRLGWDSNPGLSERLQAFEPLGNALQPQFKLNIFLDYSLVLFVVLSSFKKSILWTTYSSTVEQILEDIKISFLCAYATCRWGNSGTVCDIVPSLDICNRLLK